MLHQEKPRSEERGFFIFLLKLKVDKGVIRADGKLYHRKEEDAPKCHIPDDGGDARDARWLLFQLFLDLRENGGGCDDGDEEDDDGNRSDTCLCQEGHRGACAIALDTVSAEERTGQFKNLSYTTRAEDDPTVHDEEKGIHTVENGELGEELAKEKPLTQKKNGEIQSP